MSASKPRSLLAAAAVLAVTSLAVVGCHGDTATASMNVTMHADGYALFSVDNPRQQRNDVTVTVSDADPGATYVLLYSSGAPRNVGWFLFDPSSTSRCGGDIGPHCEVPGFGYLADVATVSENGASVTLRDDRCGCDADRQGRSWTGHWAVMRIERTNRSNEVRFEVEAIKVKSHAEEPDIDHLQ